MTLLRIVARVFRELLIIWTTIIRQSWQTTIDTPRKRSAINRCSGLRPPTLPNVAVVDNFAGLPVGLKRLKHFIFKLNSITEWFLKKKLHFWKCKNKNWKGKNNIFQDFYYIIFERKYSDLDFIVFWYFQPFKKNN